MKLSIRKGFGFGLTSGIITTLGMIVGLNSGTHSRAIVIGGILMIAVADALSDAMGIHISEEAENKHSETEIWESTLSTFATKFIFAVLFVIPILIFKLQIAIIVSIIWGLSVISVFSIYLADKQKISRARVIIEHLTIALVVIVITHLVGILVRTQFI